MKILAYDASGSTLSIGLFENQKKLSEITSESPARHSDVLVPMIQKVLKKHSIQLVDLDILAVCLGPGSFTGLRVGIGTAKVLAYLSKIKIVGISVLEAIAREALGPGDGRVAVQMDARKTAIYGAVYEKKGIQIKPVFKPALVPIEKFSAMTKNERIVRADQSPTSASRIAEGAWPLIVQKKFIDPFKLEPLYLQARDCNVTYAARVAPPAGGGSASGGNGRSL